MAKKEHLDIIRQGVTIWNNWRKINPSVNPDLSNVNLCRSNLTGANFRGVNFWEANLSKADLGDADFTESDLCFADFGGSNLTRADLSGTDLTSADFSGANLSAANFRETKLWGANLTRTDIAGADFEGADLNEADLSHANIVGVNFRGANFSDAKIVKATLSHTDLSHSNLSSADLTGSAVAWITFADTDLSRIRGLDTVKHDAPSSIGIDTVYRSRGAIPEAFLRGAGIPNNFISQMGILAEQPLRFYSCFISHAPEDQAFAEKLCAALHQKDVRCWTECHKPEEPDISEFSEEDNPALPPPLPPLIPRTPYSVLLLLLSENSIDSEWVKKEIRATFEEKRRDKNIVRFPICADSVTADPNQPRTADIARIGYICDFSQWKDAEAYQNSFDRLFENICRAFPEPKNRIASGNPNLPAPVPLRGIANMNFPESPNEIIYRIIGDNNCPLYNLGDELKLSGTSLRFPRDKAACLILLEDIMEVHTKYEAVGGKSGYSFRCTGCTGAIRLKYHKEKKIISVQKLGEDIDEMVELLSTFPMFQILEERNIRYLARSLNRKEFSANDIIIKKGQPGENLYVVVAGKIEVVGEGGISIASMGRGEVFGEMSLLSGNPVGATIRVMEPTTVLYLEGRDFKKFLNEFPALHMYFTRLLAGRMAEINLKRSEEFSSGMVGRLSEMPPSELFQTFNVNQKTGVLHLQLSRGSAALSFREGQLVRAEYDGREGKDAFYEMLKERDGRFKFTPGLSREDILAKELEDFMWLLMEGTKRMDERYD